MSLSKCNLWGDKKKSCMTITEHKGENEMRRRRCYILTIQLKNVARSSRFCIRNILT